MRCVFILASTSPRRRELIQLFGQPFHFCSADVDETPCEGEPPDELVRRLGLAKVERGAAMFPHDVVIACDTIGVLGDEILGKPRDADDAIQMLTRLRARPHFVYSGIALARDSQHLVRVATTTVWMRDYTDDEIRAYVATGDPLDKAASYAIQHNGFRPVARLDGCQANVMGLPLCHLQRALRDMGIDFDQPDLACQSHLQITCPVAHSILTTDY